MERKEIVEKLKKIIVHSMPNVKVDGVNENTRLIEDLKFDSLGLMMLAMEMEEAFNISFNEPVNFVTVKDVVDFVEARNK